MVVVCNEIHLPSSAAKLPNLELKTRPKQLKAGNTKRGKYHCTIDLLFVWFGISCMTRDNFCFYLQNRLIQTSQTGGQWYSDTSPFFPALITTKWVKSTLKLIFLKLISNSLITKYMMKNLDSVINIRF